MLQQFASFLCECVETLTQKNERSQGANKITVVPMRHLTLLTPEWPKLETQILALSKVISLAWTLIRRRLILVSKLAFLMSVVVELESWFRKKTHQSHSESS